MAKAKAKATVKVAPKKAKFGERMIEVRVRFWTNDIAKGKGMIQPKSGWSSGVVAMATNESHGIKPEATEAFQSLPHLIRVIERVLIGHGISLHPSHDVGRYMKPDPKAGK